MASLSLYTQFETNLISNRKVIELLLQLKSAKAHGKNYIKVRPPWSAIFSVIVYLAAVQFPTAFLDEPLPEWTIPLKEEASLLRNFYRDHLRPWLSCPLNVLNQKS